jgi:hypothetical protein
LFQRLKDTFKDRTFNKPQINETPWQNVAKPVIFPATKRPSAFDPNAPMRLSNKPG